MVLDKGSPFRVGSINPLLHHLYHSLRAGWTKVVEPYDREGLVGLLQSVLAARNWYGMLKSYMSYHGIGSGGTNITKS